jgi:hypothetical protein
MGRTDLRLGVSEAKYRQELAGGIQKFAAPRNPNTNPLRRNFPTNKSAKKSSKMK